MLLCSADDCLECCMDDRYPVDSGLLCYLPGIKL